MKKTHRRGIIVISFVMMALAAYLTRNYFPGLLIGDRDRLFGVSSAEVRKRHSKDLEFGDHLILKAFENKWNNVQVKGMGRVIKILADDTKVPRHQRFIIRLSSGHTLLVAHNIDLSPRVEALAVGDKIKFVGVYEYNAKGGVLHYTHRDPKGKRERGWILHRGRVY